MAPRKQAARKDKPKRAPWTVVHIEDVTRFRYQPGPDHPGTNEEHATRLSTVPRHLPPCWTPVKIEHVSQHATPGMTLKELKQAVQDSETSEPLEAAA